MGVRRQARIEPSFAGMKHFGAGYAAVRDEESQKWGVIDKNGYWTTRPRFDDIGHFHQITEQGIEAKCDESPVKIEVKSAADKRLEAKYKSAMARYEEPSHTTEDYEELAEAFRELGDYEDSKFMMRLCSMAAAAGRRSEQYGTQQDAGPKKSWRDTAEKIAIAIAIIMFFSIALLPHVMALST